MPHSHHSHSGQFCAHAQGSLEDVIKTAIAKGFTTYGLSEHVPRHKNSDLYPEEIEAGLKPEDLRSRFDAYIMEAHRLREVYYDKINLLIGLETEYISSVDLDALESLLAQYGQRIDYVVGSIHHVANIPIDFDRATYERAVAAHDGTNEQASIDSFLSAYFDAQYHMLLRIKPEVVGHVDLCRLYEPVLKLQDYPDAWDKLARNIQFVVDYGGLFEFNAAALRKGWPGAYPGEDVVRVS
jgi:histidinol-phosphatase (PHP family)